MYHQDIVFWFRVENAMLSAVLLLKVGAEGFEPPPAGLEPAILPSYTIPPVGNSLMKIKI